MNLNTDIIPYVVLALVIYLAALTYVISRLLARFNRFARGDKVSIVKLLEDMQTKQDINSKSINTLSEGIIDLKNLQKMNLQKQALIRFNPFEETGGDQSFVFALLDGENNGVVISSLHSRESTRVYAKPVVAAKAIQHQFSKEEKEVVEKAARQS